MNSLVFQGENNAKTSKKRYILYLESLPLMEIILEEDGPSVFSSALGCFLKFFLKIRPSSDGYGTCHVDGRIIFATRF